MTNSQTKCNFLFQKTSEGVLQPKTLRGRLFSCSTKKAICWSSMLSRLLCLGKYSRIRPFVFRSYLAIVAHVGLERTSLRPAPRQSPCTERIQSHGRG
ncbi:hypothetical protein GRZ59_12670 [Lactobacillus paracasei]|nr:hypothetical protein [Lacticaseibacillus paracasei]